MPDFNDKLQAAEVEAKTVWQEVKAFVIAYQGLILFGVGVIVGLLF
jgi:hypothetical protein